MNLKLLSTYSFYIHYLFSSWGSSFMYRFEMASETDLSRSVSHRSLMVFPLPADYTHTDPFPLSLLPTAKAAAHSRSSHCVFLMLTHLVLTQFMPALRIS